MDPITDETVSLLSLSNTIMQRQSLGSPGSNHHHHSHGGVTAVDSQLTAEIESSQDSKRLSLATPPLAFSDHEDEKTKLLKSSSVASKKKKKTPEKIIHGIPFLTFLCFLILYLSSHDPSQLELDAFGGFKTRPEATKPSFLDTRSVSEVMEIGKGGDAAGVGNRRDLRESSSAAMGMKIRLHRKLGDF